MTYGFYLISPLIDLWSPLYPMTCQLVPIFILIAHYQGSEAEFCLFVMFCLFFACCYWSIKIAVHFEILVFCCRYLSLFCIFILLVYFAKPKLNFYDRSRQPVFVFWGVFSWDGCVSKHDKKCYVKTMCAHATFRGW